MSTTTNHSRLATMEPGLGKLLILLGPHYVLGMMLASRVLCTLGGALVIYYVTIAMRLPEGLQRHFIVTAAEFILVSVTATVCLCLFETRTLRRVIRQTLDGVEVQAEVGRRAMMEAVTFAGHHHRREAILVPATTVLPICGVLLFQDAAPLTLVLQICIAGFVGISAVLLTTYFAAERWMAVVTRHFLSAGIPASFDALPATRLDLRMNVTFGLAIAVTALMIGGLANQRALDIVRNPENQWEEVTALREHTTYILVVAVTVGLILSRMLASSVTKRTSALVQAMKRVQSGSLTERLEPTGNDEIDILTRQFNAMVEQLYRNDHVIRDLNVNLEQKVRKRTRQLSKNKQSLQRSLKKLREADQLKTQFFSNVSHELRTPLTMILAPVQRILEKQGAQLPTETTSLLRVTQVNAQRLLELINQLLEFSKLEAGHSTLRLANVEVPSLLNALVLAAAPLAEQRGVELKLEIGPNVGSVGADEEKVDTILTNLLSNALKFTPAGGEVKLSAELLANGIRLGVRDSGIGIAPENQAKIFERFVQIDGSSSRAYAGTGLGLALVKDLVVLHGGEIHVESEVGHGSCFWFTLPFRAPVDEPISEGPVPLHRSAATRFASLAECRPAAPEHAPQKEPPPNAYTIVVADDTPEMRMTLDDILGEYYRVVLACDGAEGLEAVRRESPEIIISDVMMPHVDGYEFCRQIKSDPELRHIPFVMLTAKAEMSMKIEGLEHGADDYLVKPFDTEELRARVRSLIRVRQLHRQLDARNSDLEQAIAQLRAAQTQLVQSEKMNSLGQLVAGIAHEINNAINAVYNGIQPLQTRARRLETAVGAALSKSTAVEAGEKQEIETAFSKIMALAGVIENGASRTARIVRDLRTFSHPGLEASDAFDLHASLEVCLNLLAHEMRHRITVHRDFGEVGIVRGPSGQLNQVFMNILNNAQQAIDGDGEITIRTERIGEDVLVVFRDTGCGMTEEVRKQIFNPFFTTKEIGVGTGLGLSISYSIINQLGGSIECQSEVGRGTAFSIRLPCNAEAVEPATSGTLA